IDVGRVRRIFVALLPAISRYDTTRSNYTDRREVISLPFEDSQTESVHPSSIATLTPKSTGADSEALDRVDIPPRGIRCRIFAPHPMNDVGKVIRACNTRKCRIIVTSR